MTLISVKINHNREDLHKMTMIVHHTDFEFQSICKEGYGINRGVYNAIDDWFYNKGIINIVERREIILEFLSYMIEAMESESPFKVRFGSKGLVINLKDFWSYRALKTSDIVNACSLMRGIQTLNLC